MTDDGAGAADPAPPLLVGRGVTLRPGRRGDAGRLHAIMAEPSVSRWWGKPTADVAPRDHDIGGCWYAT